MPYSCALWRIRTPTDSGPIMKNSHRDDNLRSDVERARRECPHPTGVKFVEIAFLAGHHYLRARPEKPEEVTRL